MNALDWAIAVLLLLSMLLAAAQGFFFEVFSLAGAVAGYILAAWDYGWVALWLMPYMKSPTLADLAGFLVIFLGCVLLGGAAARIARWAMKEAGLRWADRLLGGVFGLFRGSVIVTVGLMALTAFAGDSHELSESKFAAYFLVAGRGAIWLAPSAVRQKFHQGLARLRPTAVKQDISRP